MSHTYAYALAISILLLLTLTPVLASFTFERGFRGRVNRLWNAIARFYHWVFVRILRWPRVSLAMITLIALAALSTYPLLREFLSKLLFASNGASVRMARRARSKIIRSIWIAWSWSLSPISPDKALATLVKWRVM
jgi:Cu/Ag efflux pump CusA